MSHALHRFAHEAMTTTFEAVIANEEARYARQAADAAFAEIDAIERVLSRYQESSDIAQLNRSQPGVWVKTNEHAVACLALAITTARNTLGAFDPTVGSLMRYWHPEKKTPRKPPPQEFAKARACVGSHLIEIDESLLRVRVLAPDVILDLGGIGKGYALDKAAAILQDWDIHNALLQSGESTVLAWGDGPDGSGWAIAAGNSPSVPSPLGRILLHHAAVSGSGVQVRGRHIMDPRTGKPVRDRVDAWALAPTAGEADALSTAFMIMPINRIRKFCQTRPDAKAMILTQHAHTATVIGHWPTEPRRENRS